eukprot:gene7000-7743_t
MLEVQGKSCGICKEAFGSEVSHVDHNHATGAVRGILCMNCNTSIGKMKDNPSFLVQAATYLIKADGFRESDLTKLNEGLSELTLLVKEAQDKKEEEKPRKTNPSSVKTTKKENKERK